MEKLSVWRRGTLMSRLFWPVLFEQVLNIMIGIVSTILVSNVGPSAISGVSLVDQFNNVFIAVFNALATGTTVVIAHMIGSGKTEDAGKTSVQSLVSVTGVAFAIGVIIIFSGDNFLRFLYGHAEAGVLSAGNIYVFFSAFSYPFIALYSISAGIMRASGNSKTPLMCVIISNIVNIILAVTLLYGLKLGVYAVSISMLAARITSGVLAFIMLKRGKAGFDIPKITFRIEKRIIGAVMNVGIPAGIDQFMLQGVRVILASFMSGMGTPSLQANSISNSMNQMITCIGLAFCIVTTTVTGQAFGARDYKSLRRSAFRLCLDSIIMQGAASALIIIFFNQVSGLYNPTPEALTITWQVMRINVFAQTFLWTCAFVLAYALRSVGQAKFTMVISIVALLCFRLTGAWYLGLHLGWGVNGIWISMYLDWAFRCIFVITRFLGKGWQTKAEKKISDSENRQSETEAISETV